MLLLMLVTAPGNSQVTELSVQTGHIAAINKVVFSPDGKLLASSDDQNRICIWDMLVLTQMSSFYFRGADNNEKVSMLAVSSDNRYIVAGTTSGSIMVWDIAKSEKAASLKVDNIINDLNFVDNTRCLIQGMTRLQCLDIRDNSVTGVCDKRIGDMIIDRQKSEISYIAFDGEAGTISCNQGFRVNNAPAMQTDLTKILSGKYSYIQMLKLGNGSVAASGALNLKFFTMPSEAVSFSASAQYIDDHNSDLEYIPATNTYLVSNSDGLIYVYDFARKKLVRMLNGHVSGVNSLAMHPSGNIFASGSADRSIIIWNALDFRQIKRFYARASAIGCIEYSPKTRVLAFGNELGYTKAVNLSQKNPEILAVRNHQQKVKDIVFVNDDNTLITCSDDNHITKLSASDLKIEKRKKYRSNAAPKYILADILSGFGLYTNPYMFIDSLAASADQTGVIACAHEDSVRVLFRRKLMPREYKYLFSISDLKRHPARNISGDFRVGTGNDSIIAGVNVYNRDYGHRAPVTDAVADKENNRLITSSEDATLKIWDIATGNLIVTIIPVDRNKRVFITPDNYYFAPKNSLDAIGFKQGSNFYPPEQFDLKFNRPDIVMSRMGHPDTTLIRMYRNAYEKRLRKAGFNEQMFTSEWHTPEINILGASETGYSTDKSSIDLDIKGADSRYKLDRLNVWINDVPVYGTNGISLRSENSNSVSRKLTIPLSTGENKIRISVMNEKGVESLRESRDIIRSITSAQKPDLYVIAMSVSHYLDSRFNLEYSVKDGTDIATMFGDLKISASDYSHIIIDTLFDKNATRENFFALKEKLMKTDTDDEVVLFVSGHGLLDKNLDFYFGTYDIDFRKPGLRGISFDNMESLLDSIPARKKLMMMDACHSGEIDKEAPVSLIAQKSETSRDVTFRGNIMEYNFRGAGDAQQEVSLDNTFEMMQELFAGLDKGTGTVVISAAAGKGYALESPKWNNGVFTYSIINGLKNRAADRNRDKKITVSELKEYSINQVQQMTGGRQKPTVRKETVGVDWKVW